MCRAVRWTNILCMHACYHADFGYNCTVDDGTPGGTECSDFHIKEGARYGYCCTCARRFRMALKEDEKALVEEDRQRIMELQTKNLIRRGKRQGKTDRNSAHWGTNHKRGKGRWLSKWWFSIICSTKLNTQFWRFICVCIHRRIRNKETTSHKQSLIHSPSKRFGCLDNEPWYNGIQTSLNQNNYFSPPGYAVRQSWIVPLFCTTTSPQQHLNPHKTDT